MKIKITKALPARQIHLAVLAAGSVIDIDDRIATRLLGWYAEEVEAKTEAKTEAKPEKKQAAEPEKVKGKK